MSTSTKEYDWNAVQMRLSRKFLAPEIESFIDRAKVAMTIPDDFGIHDRETVGKIVEMKEALADQLKLHARLQRLFTELHPIIGQDLSVMDECKRIDRLMKTVSHRLDITDDVEPDGRRPGRSRKKVQIRLLASIYRDEFHTEPQSTPASAFFDVVNILFPDTGKKFIRHLI